MSIRFRISFLFTFLVTLILILLSSTVYYFASENRKNVFKSRLKNRAVSTAQMYGVLGNKSGPVLEKMDSGSVSSLYKKTVIILGPGDHPVYSYPAAPSEPVALDPETIRNIKEHKEFFFTDHGKEGIGIQHADSTSHFIVAISAYDSDGIASLNNLKKILATAFLAGIFIILLSGYLFATQLVKPLAKMTWQANMITSNNLSQRIEYNNNKDELNHLASTFNDLLDRLQESFQIQRRFISHASHELSTPLTVVSSQLEVALQKDRDTEEYKNVLASVYEDVQQMQQLTRSLLEIAKAGSQGSIDLQESRVDEILIKVAADVEKQNPDWRVMLHFGDFPDDEKLIEVFGNPDLLNSALKNLVENGCKYSEDKIAFASIRFEEKKIIIEIKSKGDIIAESDIQQIFQPFFRTGSAQHKPGFGLGLTLTRRIILLHKGKIEVSSDLDAGTKFIIILPSAAAFN
jgi:signal transduction histidine kinase